LWQIGGTAPAQAATLILWGGIVWYLVQQTLWFRTKLGTGYGVAALNAMGASLAAALLIALTAMAIGYVTAMEAR
jgi:hypothetical protein